LTKIGQKLRSPSKTKGRYFGQTDRQTDTQVILYLSNAMDCIGQTMTNKKFLVIPEEYGCVVTIHCIDCGSKISQVKVKVNVSV